MKANDRPGKSWRERIAQAATRGRFTHDDLAAQGSLLTCLAAEVAGHYGVSRRMVGVEGYTEWDILWKIGDKATGPMARNDFALVDRLLDAIEDEAARVKRGEIA